MNERKVDISDQEIIRLFKQNKTKNKAFSLLVKKYQQRIYWLVRKMLLNHEESNDLTQDIFVKIWQKLDGFRGDAQLYTWIYRLSTNVCLNYLNKKNRRTISSLDDHIGILSSLKADNYFNGNELQQKLQMAIQQLPDKQRLVFNMRYFEEKSYNEMADIFETSQGSLKASYHHAVKKIENFFRNSE